MNIQIFGTEKCFETKKARRYFKERGIPVQFIDLNQKKMSKGEFTSIKQALLGYDVMINPKAKDQKTVLLVSYLVEEDKEEKIFENQQILVTPIVRDGKKATVGYCPNRWKEWEA